MASNKLLFTSLGLIALIAIIHFLALKNYWYFIYKSLDLVLHLMGGFWIAISVLWVISIQKYIVFNTIYKFVYVVISVILVGIVWEVFELKTGNTFTTVSNYWRDTYTDMASNIIGGMIAYFYFIRSLKVDNIDKII
jgi:hypothetical protein